MKNFKKIMMMGFMLLIVMLSKSVMALGLDSFTNVQNFSVVIGDSMYNLDYANNPTNARLISDAVVKNKGEIFIKSDDSGWIKNSDGTKASKDAVDISTIKYNNGKEIGSTVDAPVKDTSGIPVTLKAREILQFTSAITKTGETTATFKYRVLNEYGIDITKTVLDIEGSATSYSSVIIDPLSGTGTITFETSAYIDKDYMVVLSTGKNLMIMLSSKASAPINSTPEEIAHDTQIKAAAPISEFRFDTKELTKTSDTTAIFKYQVINKNGSDITQAIPASQLVGNSIITSLDPSTGTGTITYPFSDTNEKITLTLTDTITGVTTSSILDTISSKIDKIKITSTKIGISGNKGYALYSVYDQYGKDVTYAALGDNVSFSCNIAQVKANNGVLTITANVGIDFSTISSLVINGYDLKSGVSTSVTLATIQG
ncbi:hypothetical protein LL037_07705 [Clostridium estertheticum]|uniref:hypothetical protein n=1 Tax=Clostridium estertheticum TaxID=238834 RepID=UPI001C0CC481|nr:hypothetical protein [Clostridium estertheticum]MBU3199895.1 hypothetical protein [Clostridium estertheticum]WAG67006.1 hypothetical protein LL037_07705 [Clostridium estertheticum]